MSSKGFESEVLRPHCPIVFLYPPEMYLPTFVHYSTSSSIAQTSVFKIFVMLFIYLFIPKISTFINRKVTSLMFWFLVFMLGYLRIVMLFLFLRCIWAWVIPTLQASPPSTTPSSPLLAPLAYPAS